MKKIAALFSAASLLVCAAAQAAPNFAASSLPMLHTMGTKIVDSSGGPVALRGVNLGGWLVEEPWMTPFVVDPPAGSKFPSNQDHYGIWTTARMRFGENGMQQIRSAYRNAWITPDDFARMHDMGMNCVRVPFLASLLDEPNGFQWLDRSVNLAAANHLYVILDMHGVPGQQSGEDHTGRVGTPTFFTDDANIRSGIALWTEIARRYANNPAVAGYDLINEPRSEPNSDSLYVTYDRIYRAVRAADPNHIIIIEDGYTDAHWMPYPVPAGWSNVVYSTHQYDFQAKSADDQVQSVTAYLTKTETESKVRDVPWYVGEFGFEPNGNADILAEMLGAVKRDDIAATMWSYKCTWGGDGQQNLWGLYSNTKPIEKLDMFTDTKAQLIAKCAQYRTENLSPNTPAIQAFKTAAGDNAPTLPMMATPQ